MSNRFQGKTIVVTGGARGMGAAHARAFVEEGGKVVIGDILDHEGTALASELGDSVRYRHLDVSSETEWNDFIEYAEQEFGPISILVNNAGVGAHGVLLQDMSFDSWKHVFSINVDSVFFGTRAAITSMKKIGGGSIVNVSSIAGLIGTPYVAEYTASKFAVRGFTKAVAMEVGIDGIRVNSVHPGYVRTPILGDTSDEVVIGKTPITRMASPEEIAKLVLFVASDDASYCTGAEFVADGGMSAGSPVAIGESPQRFLSNELK